MALPLSIQLYTLREQMKDGNHLPILQKLADLGFKGVEGSGYGYTAAEFRKLIEDMGMVVSSTWGSADVAEAQKSIDEAGALGTNYLVSGFWIQDFDTVDSIKRTADKLNAVIPIYKAAGLKYGIHNHWMEFEPVEGKLAVEHLLEFCPEILLEIDIYWAAAFGLNDPVEVVRKHRSRAHLLHVKDGPLVRGEPHTAAGQGKVDIPAVLAEVDPSVTGWAILELDECATDMVEAVAESYRYLVGNGLAEGNKPV